MNGSPFMLIRSQSITPDITFWPKDFRWVIASHKKTPFQRASTNVPRFYKILDILCLKRFILLYQHIHCFEQCNVIEKIMIKKKTRHWKCVRLTPRKLWNAVEITHGVCQLIFFHPSILYSWQFFLSSSSNFCCCCC